jgi:hypothetical protein
MEPAPARIKDAHIKDARIEETRTEERFPPGFQDWVPRHIRAVFRVTVPKGSADARAGGVVEWAGFSRTGHRGA